MADAMMETWQLSPAGRPPRPAAGDARPHGFARVQTASDGGYRIETSLPGGELPCLEVAFFARGLLKALRTRVYFAPEERVAGEHGHFHTFVRPRQIDPALEPAPQSGNAAAITHLVGISTDASGRLIRLFTTNRWVTGEVWYDAETVTGLLACFDITVAAPSPDLNRWVSAVVHMFRPQIADLIRARDAAVADFARAHPGDDVFEDRALQVTSQRDVDFLAQICAIEAALAAP